MNKRKIISSALTIGIVLGGSNVSYASENSQDTSKATTVQAIEKEVKTEISDEEAVDLAYKAMKDYLNKDADSFNVDRIFRIDRRKNTEVEVEHQKYMVAKREAERINSAIEEDDIEYAKMILKWALDDKIPSTINICFSPVEKNDNKYNDNTVILDAQTGEVLRVARGSRKGIFKGKVNKEKIKESIITLLDKAGLKPDADTNWDKIFVCNDGGDANMWLYVNDRKVVEVVIDLDDYSAICLNKVYALHAGENIGEI